uniref:Defensin n=1 Tax=Arabidopsis halleri subsp. halleri TaxID=81971 RepID=L0S7C4_ARAHH|nr:defensin [Arabidopsis halleri subsp. halleri]
MAKSATIVTLFFAALVFFAALEAPTMVEAQKLCKRESTHWVGVCDSNNICKNTCVRLDKAQHGSCKYVFPAYKCICYFPC